jgi:inosine/xanthosine triphosphatase
MKKLFSLSYMNPIIHVVIGSENPAKCDAVKMAFSEIFENTKIDYYPISVDSGVGSQPIGIANIVMGAKNRAFKAFTEKFSPKKSSIINQKDLYFGVGIEAGLVEVIGSETGYLDFQFTAIYNQNGNYTIGCGPAFEYPNVVTNQILNGSAKEIGDVIEKLSGVENIKEKQGAIGFLTNNRYKRADILKYSVISALIPYMNEKLYKMK